MKILLFGTSNVGKTTTGKLLAERLGITFYDLDDEICKEFQMTLEQFVNTETLLWRDQKRGRVIKKILKKEEDMVFVIAPISYIDNFKNKIHKDGIISIELFDTAEHIFDRLVFSDENDHIYHDDDYKNARKGDYMTDILNDQNFYGKKYEELGVMYRFYMKNNSPETVVDRLINEYGFMNQKTM